MGFERDHYEVLQAPRDTMRTEEQETIVKIIPPPEPLIKTRPNRDLLM